MSTLTAVSHTPDGKGQGWLQANLVKRLRSIPDGQVSETARRADMPLTQLLRLRRGESPDVKLSTLSRLARGLGIPPTELLADLEAGETYEHVDRPGLPPKTARAVRALVKKTRELADVAERVVAELPDDE